MSEISLLLDWELTENAWIGDPVVPTEEERVSVMCLAPLVRGDVWASTDSTTTGERPKVSDLGVIGGIVKTQRPLEAFTRDRDQINRCLGTPVLCLTKVTQCGLFGTA